VSRNATGSTANVTAHFLISPFGTGSNFQDAGAGPDPVLNFANGDTQQVLASGFQWHQDPTASIHACMAVQISTANDPFIPPGLAWTAPGWPSGIAIVEDNNKAQRNLDVSHNMADFGGIDYGTIHNAATFQRDLVLFYESPGAERLRGAQVVVVGGETQAFRNGGTITLPQMQPGENRWIAIRLTVPKGDAIPVNFFELNQGRIVNGFTVLATPVSLQEAIRDNLTNHAQAFARVAAAFRVKSGNKEASAATHLLQQQNISSARYLAFLKAHLGKMGTILAQVRKVAAGGDPFQIKQTLAELQTSVASSNPEQSASNHAVLLHQMDAFSTMLQKANGDPSDILQMVRWQAELYDSRPTLIHIDCSRNVVKDSQAFINEWPKLNDKSESYTRLEHELSRSCFRKTAEALEKGHKDLEKAADRVEDVTEHHHPLAAVEKAHREYLLQLADAAK
jgi:hypothetical protein